MRVLATFVAPATSLEISAETGSGFRATIDSAEDDPRHGPSPRELVLAGLAGCTGMDVASILAKKRQVPDAYEVAVEADTAPDPPRVFTRIVVEHRVTGTLEPEAVRRAVELSATRYCPVSAMLSHSVEIEHRYRLRRPGQPEEARLVVVTGPNRGPAELGDPVHG
jgi:putative redox protein